jgi:hypothetical protein
MASKRLDPPEVASPPTVITGGLALSRMGHDRYLSFLRLYLIAAAVR